MITTSGAAAQQELLKGIFLKTLTWGENLMLVQFDLKAGSSIATHSHPHEQIGYLVTGRLELHIGDEPVTAMPGDSWCIPGGLEHSATAKSDCVAVEVFSPVREDYLPA